MCIKCKSSALDSKPFYRRTKTDGGKVQACRLGGVGGPTACRLGGVGVLAGSKVNKVTGV